MHLQFKKWMAGIMAAVLLMPGTLAYAAAAEGEILSVGPKGAGLWVADVKTKEGTQSFILSLKTAIKKEISVEEVKAGDHLAPRSAPSSGSAAEGAPAIPGIKGGLDGMSPQTKKALGLPDIPNMPSMPQIPKIPGKEQVKPPLPPKNQSDVPEPGPAAAAADEGLAQGGGAPAKAPPKEEPEVKTQDQILQEKGFQNQKLLFPPGKDAAARQGAEVLQVKRVDKGFELTLNAGKGQPQKFNVENGKKVLKILAPEDLKKNDRVQFEFEETGKVIGSLMVK